MSTAKVVSSWYKSFLHLIFPHLCAGCQKENIPFGELFCVRCEHSLSITSFHYQEKNECLDRLEGKLPVAGVTAMFRFYPGGIIQKIIHSIKYQNQPKIAYHLGIKYGSILLEVSQYQCIDMILPVPLHAKKQRKRGYNQSEHFARGLSFSMQIPVMTHVLKRTKYTETQTRKSKAERLANLEDAFKIFQGKRIHNKNILIVDDVLTTGATLESCGLSLLPHLPKNIYMATIAVAE